MGPFPKGVFLTKGVGKHREKLNAFELSLRSAQIAEYNLVRVKSILGGLELGMALTIALFCPV